jgi:uncharacterized protein DUF3618
MSGPNQEEIKQEIERTREHLGETVEALAAKADVKARAQAKAADATTKAQAKVGELSGQVRRSEVVQRRWPLAVAAGVLVAGAVAVWRWRKK